jgi:hypothetical protein
VALESSIQISSSIIQVTFRELQAEIAADLLSYKTENGHISATLNKIENTWNKVTTTKNQTTTKKPLEPLKSRTRTQEVVPIQANQKRKTSQPAQAAQE